MNGIAQPHLHASGVRKGFQIGGRRLEILRGIDLDVARGEALFLVGSSGAGKTTLLYTLAGLERPDAGDVLLDGRPLYGIPSADRARLRNSRVGFVFQNYCLLPELTAEENVSLPARLRGGRGAGAARACALLERVGLAERAAHLPAQLSGGEQQRVAIARALANDPALVFADEPTGNLDSRTGRVVMDLLLALTREGGRTLIVVTHDAALARRGDRRIRIVDGRLSAAPDEPGGMDAPPPATGQGESQ